MSVVGGYEVTVSARAKFLKIEYREYGQLLYGIRFPPKLKRAVCKSYVRPAVLSGCDVWCPKESEMVIL